MKRIVAFFVIGLLALGILVGTGANKYKFEGLEKVCFVTDLTHSEDENSVISGNDVYITVGVSEAKETMGKLDNIKGYVLYFNNDCDKDKLLNIFLDYSSDEYLVGNTRIINGYSSKYSDFRLVDGKKYNVQVAFSEENVLVGFPMILTGF